MRRLAYLLWSQLLLCAGLGSAYAQAPLFDGDAVLDVELRGPLKATLRDKRTPGDRPFELAVEGTTWPVDVRTRGKSRVVFCSFPPLRLNFDRDRVTAGPFAGQDKLKLVTHCRDGARSDDNLLEEFVAYRIFSLLTERSHRVRLLRVTYIDSDRPQREPQVRRAFAIESIEQVAARTEGQVSRAKNLVKSRIARDQAARMFVFQYLIANVDWSLVKSRADDDCCHNVHIVRAGDRDYLVPYDFDLSGLVSPRYGRRTPNLRNGATRKRAYTGYCLDGLPLEEAVAFVAAQQTPVMAVIDGLPWSDADAAAKRRAFFEAFFEEAAAGGLAERMAEDCVG